MTTTTQTTGAKPTYRLFVATGKSAGWREIGAAWPHKDGEGFSIICEAMPLQGRIFLRKATPRKPKEQGR